MSTGQIGKWACWVAAICMAWAGPGRAGEAAAPAGADPLKETPEQRDRRMAWWREARFGMFIHWGLYAVPAGVWKGKEVAGIGEWIMNRARIPVEEYEKLVPQFNPVKFNAGQWVAIAKGAGMKYIVITSKHHDGFCLWDSKVSDYDIMATPFKRDILKELSDECHKQGLKMCFYHSIMDWHHPQAKGEAFDKYRQEYLKPQLKELLTNFGEIGVLWFDGEWIKEWTDQQGWEAVRLCRSLQPQLIVNNRIGKSRKGMQGISGDARSPGDFGTPEQQIPATGLGGLDWETCMTMNGTWGFKTNDHNWKSTTVLLRNLVDIASKGGNFLLNVGPTAEGLIPEPSVERLGEMGKWMKVNGQSIYGTQASPFKRLPWGRCTTKPAGPRDSSPNTLYLHVFNWPKDGKLLVPGLAAKVDKAYLLSDEQCRPLKTAVSEQGVMIDVPEQAPDAIDTVIVLLVPGKIEVAAYTIAPAKDGSFAFEASVAELHGSRIQFEPDKNCLGFWTDPKDWVSWDFQAAAPGAFAVEITYACEKGSGDSAYEITVGSEKLQARVKETGSWIKFAPENLGTVKLDQPGPARLTLKPKSKPGLAVMNLRSVRLVPVR